MVLRKLKAKCVLTVNTTTTFSYKQTLIYTEIHTFISRAQEFPYTTKYKENSVCFERLLQLIFSLNYIIFFFSLLLWEIYLNQFGTSRKVLPYNIMANAETLL